jgi:hypothetical protein
MFQGHPVGHVRMDICTHSWVIELKALVSDVKDPGILLNKYESVRPHSVLVNFGAKQLQILPHSGNTLST